MWEAAQSLSLGRLFHTCLEARRQKSLAFALRFDYISDPERTAKFTLSKAEGTRRPQRNSHKVPHAPCPASRFTFYSPRVRDRVVERCADMGICKNLLDLNEENSYFSISVSARAEFEFWSAVEVATTRTGPDGSFELNDIPASDYTIRSRKDV